jgi:hypothetical protein
MTFIQLLINMTYVLKYNHDYGPAYGNYTEYIDKFADSVDPEQNLSYNMIIEEYGHLINATCGPNNFYDIIFNNEKDLLAFILKYS